MMRNGMRLGLCYCAFMKLHLSAALAILLLNASPALAQDADTPIATANAGEGSRLCERGKRSPIRPNCRPTLRFRTIRWWPGARPWSRAMSRRGKP